MMFFLKPLPTKGSPISPDVILAPAAVWNCGHSGYGEVVVCLGVSAVGRTADTLGCHFSELEIGVDTLIPLEHAAFGDTEPELVDII